MNLRHVYGKLVKGDHKQSQNNSTDCFLLSLHEKKAPGYLFNSAQANGDRYAPLVGSCPNCGVMIEKYIHRNHCSDCGQKIDWNGILSTKTV